MDAKKREIRNLECQLSFREATTEASSQGILGTISGREVWANPEYANNVLGWTAEVPIEETMRSAWAWQCRLRERGIM